MSKNKRIPLNALQILQQLDNGSSSEHEYEEPGVSIWQTLENLGNECSSKLKYDEQAKEICLTKNAHSPIQLDIDKGLPSISGLSKATDLSYYGDNSMSKNRGSEYVPESSSSATPSGEESEEQYLSNLSSVMNMGEVEEDLNEQPSEMGKKMKRKRGIRRTTEWLVNKKKKLRNSGQAYKSDKKRRNEVRAKNYKFVECSCHNNCKDNIPDTERRGLSETYWATSSWDMQTGFILQHVKEVNIKRRYSNPGSRRLKSREYQLGDKPCCKKVFMSTLDVTSSRIDYTLKNKLKVGVQIQDQRGMKEPPNKISEDIIDCVKQHINSFPKYVSHYSRTPKKKYYLHPSLTRAKMYALYCEYMKSEHPNELMVKEHKYREIFAKDFDLSIYIPSKDTCNKCDGLNNQIKHETEPEKKAILQQNLDSHISRAEAARKSLSEMIANAKNNMDKLLFTFDLEKTLPVPHLNTNVVYYKRQLWCYNLGVHELNGNTGHMYLWHETQGKRGSVEVTSCLLKFIQTNLKEGITKIISFSDCCGGQNRNINLVIFMNWIVKKFKLESWEQRFLEPGHSFLPNDSDFGDIEKRKHKGVPIYIPDDWVSEIGKARIKNFFTVTKMGLEDFVWPENLQEKITNRKVAEDNESVKWLQIRCIKVEPSLLGMQFKYLYEDEYRRVSYQPAKLRPFQNYGDMVCKYETPPLITAAKYNDLMELLQFIPPIHHDFYKSLPHQSKTNTIQQEELLQDAEQPEDQTEEHRVLKARTRGGIIMACSHGGSTQGTRVRTRGRSARGTSVLAHGGSARGTRVRTRGGSARGNKVITRGGSASGTGRK